MLIKTIPTKIAELWPQVKQCVMGALPQGTDEQAILSALLDERLQMWLHTKVDNEVVKLLSVVTTQLQYDAIVKEMSLLIYTVYGIQESINAEFAAGLVELKSFAKRQKCKRIVAYTTFDHVVELAKSLGADVSVRFISFNVE